MKTVLSALVILLIPTVCLGDELILKSGKRIEWKSITDEGETYAIVTPTGANVSVKKSEVERLHKIQRTGPLTGATFTFDRKRKLKRVNLLQFANVKGHIGTGEWSLTRAGLRGGRIGGALVQDRVPIEFTPPEEYDIDMVATRTDGKYDLYVGLVGGGKQFLLDFDCQGQISGINKFNGGTPLNSGAGIPGKFFENGKYRTIKIMVRRDAVVVQVDRKDWLVWKADWSKLSMQERLVIPNKSHLLIGTYQSKVHVRQMILSHPK